MPEVRYRGAGAGGLAKDAARVIEIRNWEQREEQEAARARNLARLAEQEAVEEVAAQQKAIRLEDQVGMRFAPRKRIDLIIPDRD